MKSFDMCGQGLIGAVCAYAVREVALTVGALKQGIVYFLNVAEILGLYNQRPVGSRTPTTGPALYPHYLRGRLVLSVSLVLTGELAFRVVR